MTSLEWISTSRSEDLATLALGDLAAAAGDAEYRLIGGHMVNFHQALHPDVKVDSRSTADADAGIACQAVIANRFDASLRAMGYDRPEGNRFTRHSGSGILTIDVLVDDSNASLRASAWVVGNPAQQLVDDAFGSGVNVVPSGGFCDQQVGIVAETG